MKYRPGRCANRSLLVAVVLLVMCLGPVVMADEQDEAAATPASGPPAQGERSSGADAKPDDEAPTPKTADEREKDEAAQQEEDAEAEPAEAARPLTEQEMLIREAKALLEELHRLRQELAAALLAKAEMQRELAELRRFIEDHHEYGRDFEQYQRIREIRKREQLERQRREARERHEREREQRMQRQEATRQMRLERRAAERQEREYRQHGFEPIGMDIFVGRMAYQYRIRDTLRTRITYDPFFGFFTQRDFRDRIDFTEMILSGAVINASDEVRNIGIAITFFDGSGSQVGHEIIQVNNARPQVPYPFTSTVSMALNRPFSTSSSYVLFADRAELD